MLQQSSSAHDPLPSFSFARSIVRTFVAEQAAAGRLQDLSLNQHRGVAHLVMGPLAPYVSSDQIKINMIQRWLMEAISTQARKKSQKHNVLTGQYLFHLLTDATALESSWHDLPEDQRYAYQEIARSMMEHLEICFECGSHADDFIEIAGDQICSECCNRPKLYGRDG